MNESANQRVVCGIDPGLERTGYAVLRCCHGGRVDVVEAGVIRCRASQPMEQRLDELYQSLDQILGEHAVDTVIVEELYAHYEHPRTAIMMGHARGVIFLAAVHNSAEVYSFSATQIKKSLTGNGHASKSQMQRAITVRLGLQQTPEPADVADALATAMCWYEHMQLNELARQALTEDDHRPRPTARVTLAESVGSHVRRQAGAPESRS